jgi:hypothetical protein
VTHAVADHLNAEGVPFVFATGYSSSAIPERFRGVTRFEKPFDFEGIAREVLRLCAIHRRNVT